MPSSRLVAPILACSALLSLASCAEPVGGTEEELPVSCSGKCDGLSSIRSLYRDARDLDLDDLSSRGTNLATDQLNDVLSTDLGGVTLLEPSAFGPADLAAREDFVEDLDALSSGLLTRFGENELTTVVNETRRRHLAASGDEVFVESGFRLSAGFDHGFGIDAGGLVEGTVRLGLSGSLEGRVIHATRWDATTAPAAILSGVRSARGFVIPRSVDELRAMAPGEAFALSGEGAFGVNVGAGVPIVIADPGALTYRLVVSGALRAQIAGELDVQLVRLEGDEVVVDVGTQRSSVRSARLAVSDGWGVSGLAQTSVSLGGRTVDLGRLLDRALSRQLNDRLNLVSAEIERTGTSQRVSVVRMRFHLDEGGAAMADALSQAMRGDVRLAQALAARAEPGVVLEYDLLRSGLTSVSHAGLELFGMRFFANRFASMGSVRIATPGGAQELLFESLHRESGWFFSSHGYGRTALAGLRFDADGNVAASEVNLFVSALEGDEYMERDTLLDQLDALIVAVGGVEALRAIEVHGNALQRHVETTCNPSPAFDPCRTDVLASAEVTRLRADGRAALESATVGMDEGLRAVVLAAGDLRLASQATVEPAASLVGPPSSVVLDYRIDDSSLDRILVSGDGSAFSDAVIEILGAADVDREASDAAIATARGGLAGREASALARLSAVFDEHADRYERLSAVERARIDGLGTIGGRAVAVEVPLRGDAVDYDAASARTVVQRRSQAVRDLFDALVDAAADVDGARPELIVGYSLLSMVPERSRDVRVDLDMDLSDSFSQDFTHYRAAGQAGFDVYGHGTGAALIGGGVFDVDALIDVR